MPSPQRRLVADETVLNESESAAAVFLALDDRTGFKVGKQASDWV
jgi:hypothetical protein